MTATSEPEALGVAFRVLDVLEELGCRHQLGGSYASSIHGVPRQTHDVDIVADLEPEHAGKLAARLGDAFYLDADAMRDAIAERKPCNLIHLASGVKVDLFPRGEHPFDELGDPPRPTPVKSAEDTVLRKLLWFESGRRVSDRQWSDVVAVLRTQRDRLDGDYLSTQARELGIADLLASAWHETEG